jgi:cytosine/adenosine deaminase-related metal-dependent hydrolase
MQKKWELYQRLKENYTFEDLYTRIARGVEVMISQGVTSFRTLIDADAKIGLMGIEAALAVKEAYGQRIRFEIGTQPLGGVLDPSHRRAFEKACEFADVIGGLPSKDRPRPEAHLDVLMNLARDMNKRLDVHVDQENNPYEDETELLALKTIEYGMEGRVSAIHSISLAAKPDNEQNRVVRVMRDAGLSVIVCPSAALSMKQLAMPGPLHNSIAPVVKLHEGGVPVVLGTDNIYDFFMPIVDGDMWTEARMLMEASRFYDLEAVATMATNHAFFAP